LPSVSPSYNNAIYSCGGFQTEQNFNPPLRATEFDSCILQSSQ
jgi:hypothetical protein